MKRNLKIALFVVPVLVAVLLSSCKSHEKCPAYGQMKKAHRTGMTG